MTTTPDDLASTIATVEAQERDLVLPAFTHDDAWRLGCLLVELAVERELPVTIDVRKGPQQVFHAAREGTTPDNDSWVERKVRVVQRFGASSYLVGLRSKARGTTFTEQHQLPLQEYAAHGGAFPVRVEGVGVVGVVTVSGLAQADDHALVVEALRAFLGTPETLLA
ncbi:heme-degrading domain-containing protein [Cellulosimicrobium marinum]|uniref:heme-degrading domain-containing protein n=1 Tax=Cellulosimicrobium marinum TaxID=1638992 RepID=UPI001E42CB6D|nr:heme-degrading domain-containing protein [Cellulosimicrobium marinum]MCB7136062.1 heme-degrading domain-containing protein [Cellulosimicrobium marinum]